MPKKLQKKKTSKTSKPTSKGVTSMSDVEVELILSTFAKTNNYTFTARQFNTYPQTVKRMWEGLSEQRRQYYMSASADVKEVVQQAIEATDIEFAEKKGKMINEMLQLSYTELHSRLKKEKVKDMSDKELINAIRLLSALSGDMPEDDATKEVNSIFSTMDEAITIQIKQK